MHPLHERTCDELLENPLLATPPPEPEKPKPPRIRKPRVFKLPPRFPLIPIETYNCWCNHLKELQMAKHKVDDSPPELFPELYLKPRRLDYYARQLEENMNVNKDLLKRINLIQRTGGYVDCWSPEPNNKYNKLLCKQRQRGLNEIQKSNLYFYSRLLIARSEQLLTKELDEQWKKTKHKLILSSSLPFILFKTGKIDRDIRDPAFDKPLHFHRPKVSMDIWVRGGSKIGKVTMELFSDIVPETCNLFLTFVKGISTGHAYAGTRFFRIVPDLYCAGGDVMKDNGYGMYIPPTEDESDYVLPMTAESCNLNHTVPGVLSMVVTPLGEVSGQFNIIFKPLPQFDNKHVVFGRGTVINIHVYDRGNPLAASCTESVNVTTLSLGETYNMKQLTSSLMMITGGPPLTLERISALGLPLGTPTSDCIIRSCGWFSRVGQYREGAPNTIKFPPRRQK